MRLDHVDHRACRFPASISSWLKSLPVGCGSPQAAQQPASRHWAGELRGCSSINFPREEASGGLSLFGTPSNAATAGLIAGVPHEAARRNLLAQVRKSGGLNLHNFGMPFVQTFGAPLGPEDRPYAPYIIISTGEGYSGWDRSRLVRWIAKLAWEKTPRLQVYEEPSL